MSNPYQQYDLINLEELNTYTMGLADLQREVLELFQKRTRELYHELLDSQTQKQWYICAHNLKGASKGVGAKRIACIALELEQVTPLPAKERRPALLLHLDAAIKETNAYIAEIL